MPNGGGVALALDRRRWLNMVPLVVPHPIPLDGPALEDVESCCSEEPEHDVDQVGPPGYAQPFLVDEEEAAVEEEERELDEGEGGAGEYHAYPDMLSDRVSRDTYCQ